MKCTMLATETVIVVWIFNIAIFCNVQMQRIFVFHISFTKSILYLCSSERKPTMIWWSILY